MPESPPVRDEDLLDRVADGDRAAFEAIYERLGSAIYGLILRVLRDPDQAEEVAQEVFIEVWRTASRYDPAKGSARAWMTHMAHRRAIDRVRSVQAARDRDDRFGQALTPDYDEVAESVESLLEAEHVRRCLDGLSESQREPILLAFYESHTYSRVAEVLGVPLGTIKSRMREGLSRLRDCLGVSW